jgi:hypothetical protein
LLWPLLLLQILLSSSAPQYEQLLRACGLPGLQQLTLHLAYTLNAVTVTGVDVNGRDVMFVTGVDRGQLCE